MIAIQNHRPTTVTDYGWRCGRCNAVIRRAAMPRHPQPGCVIYIDSFGHYCDPAQEIFHAWGERFAGHIEQRST